MIKINLLPKTINEKAAIRNTAILFGVLLVIIIAGGVAFKAKLSNDTQALQAQADAARIIETEVKGLQAQAQTTLTAIQPIKQKLDFINAVLDYNQQYPKLYAQIAKWTYDKVSYSSMQCDGAVVTMAASVKSLDDLGRFLLNMYRATDLFTEVTISGVPGYGAAGSGTTAGGAPPFMPGMQLPGSQAPLAGLGAISSSMVNAPPQSGIAFTVTCKLKTPIAAPAFGAAAGATPGAPGAAPAPMPAGPPMGGPPGGPPMGPPGP